MILLLQTCNEAKFHLPYYFQEITFKLEKKPNVSSELSFYIYVSYILFSTGEESYVLEACSTN